MVVSVEQRALLVAGGLSEQPGWYVSLLAWFGPAYDTQKFMSRARMVLGGESTPQQKAQDALAKGKKRA